MNKSRTKVTCHEVIHAQSTIFDQESICMQHVSIRSEDCDVLIDGVGKAPQFLFALLEPFFRIPLLNGNSRQISDLSEEILMLRRRTPRLVRVYRETTQDCFIGCQYGS